TQLERAIASTHDMTACPVQIVDDEQTANTDGRCPAIDVRNDLRPMVRVVVKNVDRGRNLRLVGLLAQHPTAIGPDAMLPEPLDDHLIGDRVPAIAHALPPPRPMTRIVLSCDRTVRGPCVDRHELPGA